MRQGNKTENVYDASQTLGKCIIFQKRGDFLQLNRTGGESQASGSIFDENVERRACFGRKPLVHRSKPKAKFSQYR